MTIRTIKSWQVECDHCGKSVQVIAGKHWSQWLGETIFNRGQLNAHLRADRWTIGMHVLCPDCAVRP